MCRHAKCDLKPYNLLAVGANDKCRFVTPCDNSGKRVCFTGNNNHGEGRQRRNAGASGRCSDSGPFNQEDCTGQQVRRAVLGASCC